MIVFTNEAEHVKSFTPYTAHFIKVLVMSSTGFCVAGIEQASTKWYHSGGHFGATTYQNHL